MTRLLTCRRGKGAAHTIHAGRWCKQILTVFRNASVTTVGLVLPLRSGQAFPPPPGKAAKICQILWIHDPTEDPQRTALVSSFVTARSKRFVQRLGAVTNARRGERSTGYKEEIARVEGTSDRFQPVPQSVGRRSWGNKMTLEGDQTGDGRQMQILVKPSRGASPGMRPFEELGIEPPLRDQEVENGRNWNLDTV